MTPEAPTVSPPTPPQEAKEPRMWERLGICIAFQPLLWGLRVDKEWRFVSVEIGPFRFTVQWP